MNLKKVRLKSLEYLNKMDYEVNHNLPLLDDNICLRQDNEVICRSLSLSAVVACSYGYDKKLALDWLQREHLENHLTKSEKNYLNKQLGNDLTFQKQVECLNVFAWALDFIKKLDFQYVCSNDLVKKFPNLKNAESSESYRKSAKLRSAEEIIEFSDLAYCLHWTITDAAINGKKINKKTSDYVILERRKALEWMISSDNWDYITLDT